MCSLSAGCPSLSQTSLVSKTSVSLIIIIPIITDTRPKPAYEQQGLDWDCGARIQFRRVHFGVFSMSGVALSVLSSHWILILKYNLEKVVIFCDSHGAPTFLLEKVIIFCHSRRALTKFFVTNGMQFEEVIIFHNKQKDTLA